MQLPRFLFQGQTRENIPGRSVDLLFRHGPVLAQHRPIPGPILNVRGHRHHLLPFALKTSITAMVIQDAEDSLKCYLMNQLQVSLTLLEETQQHRNYKQDEPETREPPA